MAAPDYAGALIGWRVWCVFRRGDELRLASVIADDVWPSGSALVASCRAHELPSSRLVRPDRSRHGAPHEACTCGIYAARDAAAVWTYLRGRDDADTVARVLGRVLLWGRVVEHESGWRAERAYPLELHTGDAALLRRLHSRIAAPVRTMPQTWW